MDAEYLWGVLIVLTYIIGAYYLLRYLKKRLAAKSALNRTIILSLLYTLMFGLGIVGTGGDPGFAIPLPLGFAFLLSILFWVPWKIFINGVIIPFAAWWVLIFLIMIARQYFSSNKGKVQ